MAGKKNPPPQLLRKRTSQKPITSLYRRLSAVIKSILSPFWARRSVVVLEEKKGARTD